MSDVTRFQVRLIDGKLYDPWSPSGSPPSPETVAHGLANLCRYGGHVVRPYTVAEHCIWVALRLACPHPCENGAHDKFLAAADEIAVGHVDWTRLIERISSTDTGGTHARAALLGLVHDAPEGCGLVDVCGPVLRHEEMLEYKKAHERCHTWLCEGWGIVWQSRVFQDAVHDVDRSILGAERPIRPIPSDARYGSSEQYSLWPDLDLAVRHDLSILGARRVRELWIEMFHALKERAGR